MAIIDRRMLLIGTVAWGWSLGADAQSQVDLPRMVVSKDPNCGCCSGWVEHVRAAGFEVDIVNTSNLTPIKQRLGVPSDLAACHTAEIGGYAVEGHVPAVAIKRLLSERPAAKGLAVPGMPIGSPGMEVPGQADEVYDVILFGPAGRKPFARFEGARAL
jgi:hypothetical protein